MRLNWIFQCKLHISPQLAKMKYWKSLIFAFAALPPIFLERKWKLFIVSFYAFMMDFIFIIFFSFLVDFLPFFMVLSFCVMMLLFSIFYEYICGFVCVYKEKQSKRWKVPKREEIVFFYIKLCKRSQLYKQIYSCTWEV